MSIANPHNYPFKILVSKCCKSIPENDTEICLECKKVSEFEIIKQSNGKEE